jgi:hypothetical protein
MKKATPCERLPSQTRNLTATMSWFWMKKMIKRTNTTRLTATALQMTAARVVRVLSAVFR